MYHTSTETVYSNHKRRPNPVVRGLYHVGFFIADFGPLLVNLFNVIYGTFRKLIAFLIGLLIELSTILVLIGTVVFSVFHSIEFLRRGGAVGGLEYVGVVMWEVVFISSVATMTRSLMNREKPNLFSIAGFIVGFLFVEWSNMTGMNQTWEGIILGAATPILLIITEGILAYQFLRKPEAKTDEKMVTEMEPKRTEMVPSMDTKMDTETVAKQTPKRIEKEAEMVPSMVDQMEAKMDTKPEPEKEAKNQSEEAEKPVFDSTSLEEDNKENETEEIAETPITSKESGNHPKPEFGENRKMTGKEKQPESEPETKPKTDEVVPQKSHQNGIETDTETDTKTEPNREEISHQNGTEMVTKPDTKTEPKRTEMDIELVAKTDTDSNQQTDEEMKRAARKWAMEYRRMYGKVPGRVKIANHTQCKDRIAREVADELKKRYRKKKAS